MRNGQLRATAGIGTTTVLSLVIAVVFMPGVALAEPGQDTNRDGHIEGRHSTDPRQAGDPSPRHRADGRTIDDSRTTESILGDRSASDRPERGSERATRVDRDQHSREDVPRNSDRSCDPPKSEPVPPKSEPVPPKSEPVPPKSEPVPPSMESTTTSSTATTTVEPPEIGLIPPISYVRPGRSRPGPGRGSSERRTAGPGTDRGRSVGTAGDTRRAPLHGC